MITPGSTSDPFGPLLKSFRKRRHLTQQQLAKVLGVHRNTVGRWEEGSYLPESKTLVLELARHLRLGDREARQLLDASLIAPMPVWSVPYPRNPFFTGREEALTALHKLLGPGQSVALTQAHTLHGLGGIGKTQLALEYAYQHALEYSAVFWIGAETAAQVSASILRIAEQLDLPGCSDADQQRIWKVLQRWLDSHSDWLLIWDNIEDLELPQRFLSPTHQGAILLTTRHRIFGTQAQGLELPVMPAEEGMFFLLRRAGLLSSKAKSEQISQLLQQRPGEYSAAQKVVATMDGLPLALDQVGAYVEEIPCRLEEYLELYHTRRATLLSRRGEGAAGHPMSVVATLSLSFEQIEHANVGSADLLRLCAFLHPDAIPEEILRDGVAFLGEQLGPMAADVLQLHEVFRTTTAYSLLKRNVEEGTLSIHRLVQAVLQENMSEQEKGIWQQRAIRVLNAAFPEGHVFAHWQTCERLLPHVQACYALSEQRFQLPELGRLFHEAGSYLRERGRFHEAERLLRGALLVRKQMYGLEHPSIAQTHQLLARLFQDQKHFVQAEPLFLQALAFWEGQKKPVPLDLARCLGDLAGLYDVWGKHDRVEPLFQQALSICEQQLGAAHAYTLECLNDLASFYSSQGKYESALPLLQHALELWEKHINSDDRMASIIRHNLAVVYMQQKEFAQAEALYQRALSFKERHLEPAHPEITSTLTSLAVLYREQGAYKQAEALYLRILAICEPLGEGDEPKMVPCLHGLGRVYLAQGHYEQATPVLKRALANSQRYFGANHPKTASCLTSLGWLSLEQGQSERAKALLQQAWAIFHEYVEPIHPEAVLCQAILTRLASAGS